MEPERHLLTPSARPALILGLTLVLGAVGACGRGRSDAGAEGGHGGSLGGSAGEGGKSGGGGGREDLSAVAAPLDGFVFEMPCGAAAGERLCETSAERPYPRDLDPALSGARLVDATLTLGGDASSLYDIELGVEGVVEAKNYTGGEDQSQASELPADGFYVGGRPGVGNAASIYLLRVSDPPGDYFLNAIGTPADSRLRRSVFPVKYAARVRARGGSTVRLVLTDPNAHAVRNCADPDDVGCAPVAPDFLDPKLWPAPGAAAGPPDGQLLGLLVTRVTRAPAGS